MPTRDPDEALGLDEAREAAARAALESPGGEEIPGKVGLEPELFPVRLGAGGGPAGRFPLRGPGSVCDVLDRLAAEVPWLGPREGEEAPVYPVTAPAAGGRLTFEPGAQIELSTAVYADLAGARGEVDRVVGGLRAAFRREGGVLASAGLDLWHDLETVPQQLQASRYRAMAAYYDRRGPAGAVMMRHTASAQVNLDLGPRGERGRRWVLANLASPFLTATFAASPAEGAVSARALAWQALDPTRTGFPEGVAAGVDDPGGGYARAALAADVMVFREEGPWEPGEPGFSFERWIREGHPLHGHPTAEDLDYHLTTLFFEVRARGFLEFRAADAVPPPWDGVSAVLLAGLLYGRGAVERGLALLEPVGGRLPELWRRAARGGIRDDEIARWASRLWEVALAGAEGLPPGYVGRDDLARTRAFLERFTWAGRMPADEVCAAPNPASSLRWAVGEERTWPE